MSGVTLRSVRDEGGSRYLGARLTDAGDLLVEGQDLGPGVESFFGGGLREYEWAWTVRAVHVPVLFEALGGLPGEGILETLARTCSNENATRLNALLGDGKPVPAEWWSRVGD